MKHAPHVKLTAPTAHDIKVFILGGDEARSMLLNSGTQLVLALTDPDAPSREHAKWGQMCHWIVEGLNLSSMSDAAVPVQDETKGHKGKNNKKKNKHGAVMPYLAPSPPPKTGLHRYVFVALAPWNGTSEKLHLSKPEGRRHWGFDGKGKGVRDWAEENGLGVVGE